MYECGRVALWRGHALRPASCVLARVGSALNGGAPWAVSCVTVLVLVACGLWVSSPRRVGVGSPPSWACVRRGPVRVACIGAFVARAPLGEG
eukprot:scaffold57865_cov31-Tisochrysis_lutea.AAC.1